MDLQEYSKFVEGKILTTGTDRLAENTLGLVGEAGEVAEKIKKRFRDGKLDRDAVQKELGDVLFYWAALHNLLGLCPDHTIDVNINKLTDREARGVLRGSGDNR